MSATPNQKLNDLLKEFRIAMLVTRMNNGQMRARPMAVADIEPNGSMWFLTGRQSGKIDEILTDSHVAVTMQSAMKFVSVSGRASTVEDREKVARLWRIEWKVWFPDGKDDPNLVLLRVDADGGEYWDNSGTSGIKYLIEAGKALISGSKPNVEDDPKIHGKVEIFP